MHPFSISLLLNLLKSVIFWHNVGFEIISYRRGKQMDIGSNPGRAHVPAEHLTVMRIIMRIMLMVFA